MEVEVFMLLEDGFKDQLKRLQTEKRVTVTFLVVVLFFVGDLEDNLTHVVC